MNDGLVAVLVVAGTIAGVLLGARIQARKDVRGRAAAPARGREMWVPASLLALVVAFAGVVMWIAVELLGEWVDREHRFVRRPVGEVRMTRSAGGSAAGPWRVPRGFAGASLQVDPAPGSRGEDGALRVTIDSRKPGSRRPSRSPARLSPMASRWQPRGCTSRIPTPRGTRASTPAWSAG